MAGATPYVEAFVFQLTITFFSTKLQLPISEKDVLQAKHIQIIKSGDHVPSYQISYSQDVFKLWCHGMVLHGHKQGVQDNADGDGQVHKRVHDDQVHNLFQFYPVRVTLPDEEGIGKFIPAWRALSLRLFQLCSESSTNTVRKQRQLLLVLCWVVITALHHEKKGGLSADCPECVVPAPPRIFFLMKGRRRQGQSQVTSLLTTIWLETRV